MARSTELATVSGTTADAVGRAFIATCVTWARVQRSWISPVQANHVVDVEHGFARAPGHVLTDHRWADIAYGAFVLLFAGMMAVALANGLLTMSPEVEKVIDGAGRASWAVAAAGFVWALVRWSRSKVPSTVYVADHDAAVDAAALRWIAEREPKGDRPRNVWVFARCGFSPEALDDAAAAGIECLVSQGKGFGPPPRHPVVPRAA